MGVLSLTSPWGLASSQTRIWLPFSRPAAESVLVGLGVLGFVMLRRRRTT